MNEKLQSLNQVIKALEELQKNPFIPKNEFWENDFKRIISRLKDKFFKVAVVGEFSSGKSTFLNVLIGQDLLKHGAQETTATITEVYNDPTCSQIPVLDIYYTNGEIVRNVIGNEISEFTATSSKKYLVSKEIEKVVIRSKMLIKHSNICLIDTPGLNGIADNHREKTIEQIKSSHACIYLMQVRGLGQSDIEFLKEICRYQTNIIFIQNFIDELKELEGETPEEKINEQKKIIEEKIKKEVKKLNYKVIGISARKALISKVKTFKKYHDEILNGEMRVRLYDESRFENVIEALEILIKNNEKNMEMYYDTMLIAKKILVQLKKILNFQNEQKEKEWLNSSSGRNYKNSEKLIELLEKNKASYQVKINNYIESEAYNMEKEYKKYIKSGLEKIYVELELKIQEIKDIEIFKKYIEKSIKSDLCIKFSDLERELNGRVNIQFENLINNAVLRIEEYTGIQTDTDKNTYNFSLENKMKDIEIKDFKKEEEEINQLEKNIILKKSLEEKYKRDIKIKIEENNKLNSQLQENNLKINKLKSSRDSDISKLGNMPQKEERIEEYKESRGGTGFLDWLIGPKIKKIRYYDDTEQQKWIRNKNDIENKYIENESKLNQQIRIINLQKSNCEEEIRSIRKGEKIRIEEIKSLERILQTKLEYIKVQKEKAKQEYLREAKNNILKNINEYLDENIENLFINNFHEIIIANKKQVEKIVVSLFDLSYNERIRNLKLTLGDFKDKEEVKNNVNLSRIVDNVISKMEEFLCQ